MAYNYDHATLNHPLKITGNKTINLSEVNLFESLPNQTSIESHEFVEYKPEAGSLDESSAYIEFACKPGY